MNGWIYFLKSDGKFALYNYYEEYEYTINENALFKYYLVVNTVCNEVHKIKTVFAESK